MNDDELEQIQGIFYQEAPYDFVLDFSPKRPKRYRGICSYNHKVCVVYAAETYLDGLWVMLHELAHARIQHTNHSLVWEKQFVDFLREYNFPKDQAEKQAEVIGPNLREFLGAN